MERENKESTQPVLEAQSKQPPRVRTSEPLAQTTVQSAYESPKTGTAAWLVKDWPKANLETNAGGDEMQEGSSRPKGP